MILVHIHGTRRIVSFTNISGNIYKASVDYPIISCKQNGSSLTLASSSSVSSGEYYYDDLELYVYSTDINNDVFIAKHRLLFSDKPVNKSWDLNSGNIHYYEPRLLSSIGYKSELDRELVGISIVGGGTISLDNTDSYFQNIYGKYVFNYNDVQLYDEDYNILYRGTITNSKYGANDVSFQVKDNLDFLKEQVSLSRYTDDDVADNIKNNYKKRVFGKVDGLLLQSIDMVGESATLSGTHTISAGTTTLSGSSSSYFNECTPGDIIIIDDVEYRIKSISSSTSLTLAKEAETSISSESVNIRYNTANRNYNRTFQVSDKPLHKVSTIVTDYASLSSIQLDSTEGLRAGDNIVISGEEKVIESISTNNYIKLTTQLSAAPGISSSVTRDPINKLYYDGKEVPKDLYTSSNNISLGCYLILDIDFEKQLYPGFNMITVNTSVSSNTITSEDANFNKYIKPRDYISIDDGSNYYEVLDVDSDTITLTTTTLNGDSVTDIYVKNVNIVNDNSKLSADVFGETEDDDILNGTLITTASQCIYKLLSENIDSDLINSTSFTNSEAKEEYMISFVTSPNGNTLKSVIDTLNKSVLGYLSLNSELKFEYNIIDFSLDYDNLTTIDRYELLNFEYDRSSKELYRYIEGIYREQQYNYITKSRQEELYQHDNDSDYVNTNKKLDVKLALYDAEGMIRRYGLLYSRNNIEVDLELPYNSDYVDLQIGDSIIVDIPNFDHPDFDSKKVMLINSVRKNQESIFLQCVDISELFTRRCIITEDSASEYTSASNSEKQKYSYITEDNGLVDDSEIERNLIY